ncbi:15854_t:CDS:2, partial [Dentiscutata heterogama]
KKREKQKNLENNNANNLLDKTFKDYKLYDDLSQTNTIFENLTQESIDLLYEEFQQASCLYTLIEDSDLIENSDDESFMSVDNQTFSSCSSFDNHKQLYDKALQQVKKNQQIIHSVIEN